MTKNEKIILLMGWTVPFHGLSPEDAEFLARRVLEAIDWDLESLSPSDIVHKTNEIYFNHNELGELRPTDPPLWEDYGFVRPPILDSEEMGTGFLSDSTPLNAHNLAAHLSDAPFKNEDIDLGRYFGIDFESGSIHLVSGGVVPPMSKDMRSMIWPVVFANPTNIDQEGIDELVANPPARKDVEEKTFIEQESERVYEIIESIAQEYKETINKDFAATSKTPHTH
jgi:hypothetical protein